ncbi:MAG: amino acid ABC transporter permease [Proteobacteria bacterium]|nr:amino acid ABC transporter permease [Pseudomonadota bacterium]
MRYNWDWSVLVQAPYVDWLFSGLLLTLVISAIGWVIALALGSVIGVARTTDFRVARALGMVYVEVFRNVPLLVQLFLWYFVLPELVPAAAGHWLKRDMPEPELVTAIVGLGLYTACRVAEQVRSGIQSIGRGQALAGLASGLTLWQVYRYILLPRAFRIIVPALTNEFLNIFKNSSLALTIGVLELTSRARQVSEATYHSVEAFAAASLLYALITFIVTLIMRRIEAGVRIVGTIGPGIG